MERSYLIRHGLMGQVGRYMADPGVGYERGQTVVIRSHRGIELGEILIEAPADAAATSSGLARVLRIAGPDDLDRAGRTERERHERFTSCQRVFLDGLWPIELIDVEPLLDDRRTVLLYLGPHRLDVAGVLAALRAVCDLDVMLQPVGPDLPDVASLDDEDHGAEHACGRCGAENGGCGGGGGGCSDCGVKKLLSARR